MTPTPLISLRNESTMVTDDQCGEMVRAIGEQLARDVAPIWGQVPGLEFVRKGQTPLSGSAHCYIQDQPDVEGALGYHDEDEDGIPYIKVFCAPTLDNGGSVLTGADSVSCTLSHEVIELVGDGPANIWVDGPDGTDYARELCDAVEGDVYQVHGVTVSNFLYPAFFDPKATSGSKLDHLEKLRRPFAMTPGGYQIRRTEPGRVSQVFARHEPGAVHAVEGGVFLVFGPQFPHWKRALKMRKAKARGLSRA
jgi:hypothetical protein